MENNLGRKTVTPSLLTPIAKVNSSLPISYEFPLLNDLINYRITESGGGGWVEQSSVDQAPRPGAKIPVNHNQTPGVQ